MSSVEIKTEAYRPSNDSLLLNVNMMTDQLPVYSNSKRKKKIAQRDANTARWL